MFLFVRDVDGTLDCICDYEFEGSSGWVGGGGMYQKIFKSTRNFIRMWHVGNLSLSMFLGPPPPKGVTPQNGQFNLIFSGATALSRVQLI